MNNWLVMFNRNSIVAAVIAFIATIQFAFAAEQGTGSSDSEALSTDLSEIVVTANKKSEPLQKVPAAVSVMSGTQLDALGINDLTQVSALASGVTIVPVRTQAFTFIRGVGQTVTTPNADPSVAVNLNGVYLPAEIAGTAFFDVDRIEVVPGPQGTLYGRNSTGGVLNIATRTPGSDYGIESFVEWGNFSRVDAFIGVDIPLPGNLASRTAFTVIRHDGYFYNGEDDQNTYAGRETLVWTPSDRAKVTGSVTFTHDSGIGDLLHNVGFEPCPRCGSFDPRALGYSNSDSAIAANLQADLQINNATTLTYVGGYSHLRLVSKNSIFTAPAPFFPDPLLVDETIKNQSHELRVNTSLGKFDGIFGLYYFDQSGDYLSDAIPGLPAPGHSVSPFNEGSRGEAVFGQGTYSVTDALRITAGLRYSSTSKSISGYDALYASAIATPATLVPPFQSFQGALREEHVDWKAGLEYDIASKSMLYGSVATGINPGGFSNAPAVIGQLPAATFAPTTLTAYDGGLKNQFANGMVTLNLEGFHYNYNNYQVSARNLVGQNLVYNAAKATISGAQIDLHYKPTAHDQFSASVTGIHAVANELIVPGSNFSGQTLPDAPTWSGFANYQRTFDFANGAQIRSTVNVQYATGRWALYTHQPGSYISSDSVTDLNVGYFALHDRWSLQVWGRNLENNLVKSYCGNALPRGTSACFYEPPRTYGATISFKM